jgi:hypothetical protein
MSADYDALQVLADKYTTLKKPFLPEALYLSLQSSLSNYAIETQSLTDISTVNKIFEEDVQIKIQTINELLQRGTIEELMMMLHQLISTLGHTGDWNAVGEVQRIESDYAIYQDVAKAKASISELCKKITAHQSS